MNPTDAGEGFFLVLWVVISVAVLGIAMAYISYGNRRVESMRDRRWRAETPEARDTPEHA
jgi:hypothetical protein